MKLIISTTSPYSRKCRVMVRELGLENEVEEVEAQPFEDDPELIRANPLGRVPCLQLDDGQALTESALIADYLAERPETPGRGTGMTGASRRWATGCSTLPSCGAWKWSGTRGSGRTTGIGRRERGIQRALAELEAGMEAVENPLAQGPLTMAIALAYLDFRYPECDWRSGRPLLQALHDVWSERVSFSQTRPTVEG